MAPAPRPTTSLTAKVVRMIAVIATCGGVYLHMLAGQMDSGHIELQPVGHMTLVTAAGWILSFAASLVAGLLEPRNAIPYITGALALAGLALLTFI